MFHETMPPCSLILHDQSAGHDLKGHPESEQRIDQIRPFLPENHPYIPVFPASLYDILRVHQQDYLSRLQGISRNCRPGAVAFLDPDTYVTPRSWEAARG
ncbi:MAG TPA: hypothetical protein PLV88_06470, partial [Methanoregulaceae archaeon]|nr:hypothetical protein [Methanoregulaceae archaeon]